MSELGKYVLFVDSDKTRAEEFAHQTARKLELKETSLIDVVQSLGEYVNDEDHALRAKAVQYLSSVIGAVPSNFLTIQQIHVLCEFLCDRIEDGGAVGGLRKISSLRKFTNDMAIMTTRAMLEHFQDLQLRPQQDRLRILELLNGLMLQNRPALKDMGHEFVVGVTDLVSGEKDPRNLMIIFSVLKVIMVEWDISNHAEPMFDAVFCYFPITFKPPPNDPYGITAQDLKGRLRDCIAATSAFAPYAFPQLIDKLDSTSPNVKKDVLQTITACASSYSVSVISNYSITLWDSLKYEILTVQEEDLAEEALVSLQAIAIRLSHGPTSTDSKTPLALYLRPITKECNEQLQEPQHKQAKPVGQILSSLGVASSIAYFLVIKAVMPSLLTLYQAADSIAKQRALLEALVQLFNAAIIVKSLPIVPSSDSLLDQPLDSFHDRLFELTSQALMSTTKDEVSFRIVALKGLLRLCLIQGYLKDNEIGMAVQYFDEIVLEEDPNGREDLKNEAIQALVEISKIKPHLVMEITFPAFMARLPDSSPEGKTDYLITLEGLAQLSVEKSILDTLVRRLLNRLDVVLQTGGSPAYPQALLSTLIYVLGRRDLTKDPHLGFYHEKMVVNLARRVTEGSMDPAKSTALNEIPTLEILGRLMNLIVRALEDHKQSSVALQVYTLFADDTAWKPVPYRLLVSDAQRLTMILSTSLMAAIKREIPLAHNSDETGIFHLQELKSLALAEVIPSVRLAILRQIALMINKILPTSSLPAVQDILETTVLSLIPDPPKTDNAIRLTFWISKALLLRLFNTTSILTQLLTLLSSPTHGLACARGFSLLLAPDEILSKANGAVIRLLVPQRVFTICVPRLASDFRAADNTTPAIKQNYLIALSGILKSVPTDVLMPEIATLLPLLLQSLDLADAPVKAATIDTLTVILTENPAAVEGHLASLVARLLTAAGAREANPAKVRQGALRALRLVPGRVKGSVVLPLKGKVTWGLRACLDDPRRSVRKEAIECRAGWFELDEPDSE